MISSTQDTGAGVTNRLRKENPSLIITHDLCHALNLIAQKCLEDFPLKYRNLVSKLSETFSKSALKNSKFKAFLKRKKLQELTVNNYVPTRWTSFVDTLERILKLYDHLKTFFLEEESSKASNRSRKNNNNNENKNKKLKKSEYFTLENKLMLQLILILMKKLTFYIKTFEKDNLEITNLVRLLKHSKVIIGEYLFKLTGNEKYDHLLEILKMNDGEEAYQDSLRNEAEFQDYFLAKNSEFKALINEIDSEKRNDLSAKFFQYAKGFLKTAFDGMQNRLPKPDSALMNADAILLRSDHDIERLKLLAAQFGNIIEDFEISDFHNETERLEQERVEINRVIENHKANPLYAWRQESESFPLVYRLLRALELLPYSTCSVERTFSGVKNIKTEKRNKLKVGKVEAALLYKQDFKEKEGKAGKEVKDFSLNPEILKYYEQLCKTTEDPIISCESLEKNPPNPKASVAKGPKKPSTVIEEEKSLIEKDVSNDISISSNKEEKFYKWFLGKLGSQMPWLQEREKQCEDERNNKRAPSTSIANPRQKQTKKVKFILNSIELVF